MEELLDWLVSEASGMDNATKIASWLENCTDHGHCPFLVLHSGICHDASTRSSAKSTHA